MTARMSIPYRGQSIASLSTELKTVLGSTVNINTGSGANEIPLNWALGALAYVDTLTPEDIGAVNSSIFDTNSKIKSEYLPSYVDDVIEYALLSNFPTTGESGKIYIATATGKTYRWSGSQYIDISGKVDSVAGKTGIVTLTATDVGLSKVNNTSDSEKPISLAVAAALETKANKEDVIPFWALGSLSYRDSIDYSEITGTPTIPAAQVQSNWTDSNPSSVSFILNKPQLGSAAAKNTPTNGDALATEVMLGNDSRLTDSRDFKYAWALGSLAYRDLDDLTVPYAQIIDVPVASTAKQGIVKLSDEISSNDSTVGATSKAVKMVYDLVTTSRNELNTSLTSEVVRAKVAESTLTTNVAAKENTWVLGSLAYRDTIDYTEIGNTPMAYTLPEATTSVLGGVKLGVDPTQTTSPNPVSSITSRTYAIQTNSSKQLVVNVPWTDTNTTYTNGKGLALAGTTFSVNYGTTDTTACAGNDARLSNARPPTEHVHDYADKEHVHDYADKEHTHEENPWELGSLAYRDTIDYMEIGNTPAAYTLPPATSSALGGVKLGSGTSQSVAANAVSTTTSRTYAIQTDSSGQLVVNVPWADTDTNTTYTAGKGLALAGTTFSVNYGTTDTTACVGNDSRLSDARAPTSHTHLYAGSSTAGGSANTAVKLATARTINGTSFDGSTNIIIPMDFTASVLDGDSRQVFKTSTTNGYTRVGAIPNGTNASGGGFVAYATEYINGRRVSLGWRGATTATPTAEITVNDETSPISIGTNTSPNILYIDTKTKQIGINNTSPTTALDVTGTIKATTFSGSLDWSNVTNKPSIPSAYSLSAATSSALGGVKLGSDTSQNVAANTVSATTSRTYAIQTNSSGQLVVNVPWADTDTNTTYTNGTGLALSGTTFSVSYGTTGTTACVGNDSRLSDARAPTSHALTSHTASGLTTGHFLKATGATTYGFAAHGLTASDVGAASSSHTHTGYAASNHTHNYAASNTAGGAATSAEKLTTVRTINGQNFDGSANITIPMDFTGSLLDGTSRKIFKTSTASMYTRVGAMPNGSNDSGGGFVAYATESINGPRVSLGWRNATTSSPIAEITVNANTSPITIPISIGTNASPNILYINTTDKRLGINNTSPTADLDVGGTIKATTFSGSLDWSNVTNKPSIPPAYTNGTGLALSGTTFSVNYGTTGTTACVGNDSRLSDSRNPTSHTLASHTASGLTTGHFLKATGATTFGFAAHGLSASDVGAAASTHTHNYADSTSAGGPATSIPTAIGTASAGKLYFNTSTKRLYIHTGTAWVSVLLA